MNIAPGVVGYNAAMMPDSAMHIDVLALRAFEGPNILGPLPGVLLRCRAPHDVTPGLRTALKDVCQRAGIVLAGLQSHATPLAQGAQCEVWFQTPTPRAGALAVEYALAELQAHAAGDDWDEGEALAALQQKRRAETLPLQALQIAAEAASRQVPAFRIGSALQLGYGVRGRQIALDAAAQPNVTFVEQQAQPADPAAAIDWSGLGRIPILAVAGYGAEGVVTALSAYWPAVAAVPAATFQKARLVLAAPDSQAAVFGFDGAELLDYGLPFDRCRAAVVLGPQHWPDTAQDRTELAQALGLPMLVADPDGMTVLDADSSELVHLSGYAASELLLVSRHAGNVAVAQHCAAGGRVAWLTSGGDMRVARGTSGAALGQGDFAALIARALRWSGAIEL